VVVEGVYTGTQTGVLSGPGGDVPPSGRRLELPYCDVFEAEAGRIVSHHVYYDQVLFARQMGLVPDPAGAAGGSSD
jgi:ketosteroid isomerase-like protein